MGHIKNYFINLTKSVFVSLGLLAAIFLILAQGLVGIDLDDSIKINFDTEEK